MLGGHVEVGDFVRSGDAIATFVDNLTLIVEGTLAEQEVGYITKGDEARAELVTGQSVKGRVRYVAPVADESTRTFTVELEIDNTNGQLPAGVTAEIVLKGGEAMAQKISPAFRPLSRALSNQRLDGARLPDAKPTWRFASRYRR